MRVKYCSECRKNNVIATVGGPTCKHTFPGWKEMWEKMGPGMGKPPPVVRR